MGLLTDMGGEVDILIDGPKPSFIGKETNGILSRKK